MSRSRQQLQEQQQDILFDIGSTLQQTREAQGLGFPEIAKKTLISQRLLQAIETGDLFTLPEAIYTQKLILRYANYLGLDGEAIARQYPVPPSSIHFVSEYWNRISFSLHPVHLYLIYFLVVLVSVRGLGNLVQRQASYGNLNHSSSLNIQTKSAEEPVQIDIQAKDSSWIKIVVDGQIEFEGMLPQGSHRTLLANQNLTLKAGNAGGVLVAFNNEQAQTLGRNGERGEMTYQF